VKIAKSIKINGKQGFVFAKSNDSAELRLFQRSKD